METIHEKSGIAALPQFDLWSVPPTQTSIDKEVETEYRPISTLDANSTIQFLLTLAEDEYLRLDTLSLNMVLSVCLAKQDNTAVKDDDYKSLKTSNYLLNSIIKQLELEVNGHQLVSLPQTYAYRSYLEVLLGHSEEAKKTHLRSSLWCQNAMNENVFKNKNTKVDLHGRLHLDLGFQCKALVWPAEIKLNIFPNKPVFYLNFAAGLNAAVNFHEANVFINRGRMTSPLAEAVKKAIAVSPMKYNVTRTEVKHVIAPKGLHDVWIDNLVYGQLPRRMFVFMVENEAFNGHQEKDPFEFKHYNINYITAL